RDEPDRERRRPGPVVGRAGRRWREPHGTSHRARRSLPRLGDAPVADARGEPGRVRPLDGRGAVVAGADHRGVQHPPAPGPALPAAAGRQHPVWTEDPDFDIRNHIRGATVPAPGGPDEVAAVVGDLVARPLDQRRPLWEVWVLDGLEHGNVALVSKVHHAAIDGTSGNELQVAVLDLSPEIEVHEPEEPWEPEPVPTEAELLAYAAASLARQPVRVVKALRRTTQAALDVRRMGQTSSAATLPAAPFTAPRTSFNA